MAAPALRARTEGTSVTTLTLSNTTSPADKAKTGDLVIVIWSATASSGTAPAITLALTKAGGGTAATMTLNASISDGTRELYVWSGRLDDIGTGNGSVTATLTGAVTSGTRRLVIVTGDPGSGQRWATSPLVRSGSTTATTGSNPWAIPWSANATSSNPELALQAVTFASTQNPTFNIQDGAGSVTPTYPGASATFHYLIAGYSSGTLVSTGSPTVSTGVTAGKAAGVFLWAVADPTEGRGRVAAKATGRFGVIRRREGRGRAAAKGTGRGGVYSTLKTAEGRGRAAAKATGRPAPKTAGGIARTAAEGSTIFWDRIVPQSGRGRAASKATGSGRVFKRATGPGRAAAKATATFVVVRRAVGPGRAAAKATAAFYVTRRATGPGRAAAFASGHPIRLLRRSGRGNVAASAAAAFYTTVPATGIVLDQTTTVGPSSPTTTVTVPQGTTVTLEQSTTTLTLPASGTVTISPE